MSISPQVMIKDLDFQYAVNELSHSMRDHERVGFRTIAQAQVLPQAIEREARPKQTSIELNHGAFASHIQREKNRRSA